MMEIYQREKSLSEGVPTAQIWGNLSVKNNIDSNRL